MYGMVIDTTRCFGCQTCNVGCKMCNQVSGDVFWSRLESLDGEVAYQATGTFPNVRMDFRPVLCNHCMVPACMEACESEAIAKDADTGIVSIDAELCIGCGLCVEACPYAMPKLDDSTSAPVASKCTFCQERVAEGVDPYCVTSCPAAARFFGDVNDPSSEVSKLIAEKNAKVWKEEEDTGPQVYYF